MAAGNRSEIRMKDLLSHFLRRWKSILAVTVLCALALGGWQYLSVKKAHDAGNQTKEEARYADELARYQENLANAQENLDFFYTVLENRKSYRDGSLWLNLDPNNVWAAEKKYLVSETDGSAADILAVYTGAMTADHDEALLKDAFGTDNAGYAREMVKIAADNAENSFTVTVLASEKEKAEKGLAYVSARIAETEKSAQEIGKHTLKAVNEGASKSVSENLISEQSALADQIADDEDNIVRAKRSLRNVQESEPFKPGDPVVRWAVTGGVLGLALMLAMYLTTFLRKKER